LFQINQTHESILKILQSLKIEGAVFEQGSNVFQYDS
jgi:hypothetical protein